jgi:hypothetical protein
VTRYPVGTTRFGFTVAQTELRERDRAGADRPYMVAWYQLACVTCGHSRWERQAAVRAWNSGVPRKCSVCTSPKPTGKFCPVCSSCPGRSCVRCGGVPEVVLRTNGWERDGEQHTVRLG